MLLRSLLWKAARHLANDPRIREIAIDTFSKAKPKVEETARQIREAAREASPLDDPGEFARRVKSRLRRKD